jgi:hypothetical protein
LDQFQIATRSELTGSIYDEFPIDFSNAYASTGDQYIVYGKNIVSQESDSNVVTFSDHNRWFNGNKASNRVGSPVISLVGTDLDALFGGSAAAIRIYTTNVQANQNLVDSSRIFKDAVIKSGSIEFIDFRVDGTQVIHRPSYGSYQCVLGEGQGNIAKTRLGGSPKYYFGGKHFGHYTDMIRQGLDSRFVDDPTTTDDDTVTESAVKIQFVTSEYDEATMTRRYLQIRPEAIEGTSEKLYQSSNLSVFATSSYGYIDNDTPTNRTYGEFELVVE